MIERDGAPEKNNILQYPEVWLSKSLKLRVEPDFDCTFHSEHSEQGRDQISISMDLYRNIQKTLRCAYRLKDDHIFCVCVDLAEKSVCC